MKTPLLLLMGAGLGIALVFACGNDAPTDADAAAHCDCPAAEPPLDGRIVITAEATADIPAQDVGAQSVRCPDGATPLGGSCTLETSIARDITLSEAGFKFSTPDDPVWTCVWNNPTTTPNVGIVRAVCLLPAE